MEEGRQLVQGKIIANPQARAFKVHGSPAQGFRGHALKPQLLSHMGGQPAVAIPIEMEPVLVKGSRLLPEGALAQQVDGKVTALLAEGQDEGGCLCQSCIMNVRLICGENGPTRNLCNRSEQDQPSPGLLQLLHQAPVAGFEEGHLLPSIRKGGLGAVTDHDGRGLGLRQLTLQLLEPESGLPLGRLP